MSENKNARPMTMAQRRKAEQLIDEKYRSLDDAILRASDAKIAEIREEWCKKNDAKGISDKINEIDDKIDKLRKECAYKINAIQQKHADDINTQETKRSKLYNDLRIAQGDSQIYENGRYVKTKTPITKSVRDINNAVYAAQAELSERKSKDKQDLWFDSMDTSAIKLLNGVPSVSDLAKGNLKILTTPVKKLLSTGK